MKYLVLLFFVFLSPTLLAQEDTIPPQVNRDTVVKKKAPKKSLPLPKKTDSTQTVSIKDYKIISFARDTTFLDTTLTILKEYKYNYIRSDDFELMQFANVGQPYNKLGVNFERRTLYPSLGAKAKHANYAEIEDVNYYNVATPMTELMFKTTFEQGQLLDALLTFNTSKRLNFSLAYKGFRSLGKYQYSQAQSGNFKVTTNYETKNKQYSLRAHIAAQDIETQENGGLASKELQFESGDTDFTDRTRVDVVFTDANNKVLGKRYFLEHDYRLLGKGRDSLNKETTSLTIGHQFNYETKYYQYTQTAENAYFGEAFLSGIDDKASLKTTYNQFSTKFYNPLLGSLTGFVALYNYNYFFNSLLVSDGGQIQSQLKGEEISLGALYEKRIGKFAVKGNAAYTLVGELNGNMLDASAGYDINKDNKVLFSVHTRSTKPDFNFLLYQSDYENYNWQNTANFDKQNTVGVEFLYEGNRWGSLSAKYTTLNNYTYFKSEATPEQIADGVENAFIKPFQESDAIGYLKVKYTKEFRMGMFALNNSVQYQNVSQTNNVLNVPQLLTRNTLYFSSDVFKKAMYLQTGITVKYFTEYTMDSYNPVLGEFYVQENDKLGGFPMLDFFINARVKQTRIFLKAEHFNSSFSGYNFYSAPNYPYRDFVIRFGLVWNFFS